MKIRLFPIPHIIIWNFQVTNSKDNTTIENHYFLTRKGEEKFMRKYSNELSKEG